MTNTLRVLGRLRLSVASDESTSIQRQLEVITSWAEANGHQIVGWAEDTDVSGAVDPFDTPQLGNWLSNRPEEFDTIACWKLDRISRSAIRLNRLIGWCLDHDKTIASCTEGIDIGTPVGRLIANVIAFLAEGELEAMRERQRSSRRKLREAARWAGGKPPYGYQIVDSGHGKTLEIDPLAYPVVRRIVDEVMRGTPIAKVCSDLNDDGVVSPADHHRVCDRGEDEDTGSPWRTWPMKHMLTSPTLVGHVHLAGVTVRDAKGDPVLMCEDPLVTADERELILHELSRAEQLPRDRRETAALIGMVSCWFCETPLTSTRQSKTSATGVERRYDYYRCMNNCGPLIPMESADEAVERLIRDSFGDDELTKRVWLPGDSNETALKTAVAAFEELTSLAGTMTSKTLKDRLQGQLEALDSQIADLEAKPIREGRYEDRPTGKTHREAWDEATTQGSRRDLMNLIGVDVRLGVHDGELLSHPITLGSNLPPLTQKSPPK